MPAYAGISSSVEKAETDKQRVVHFLHHVLGQFSDFFFQSGFVDGADLFEQHHAVLGQAIFVAGSSMWVGSFAFVSRDVVAAAITVGLYLLPISFCKTKTGRMPPCSLPTTGLKSA